jgi:t-SNARE complex subunit (syntaxin)
MRLHRTKRAYKISQTKRTEDIRQDQQDRGIKQNNKSVQTRECRTKRTDGIKHWMTMRTGGIILYRIKTVDGTTQDRRDYIVQDQEEIWNYKGSCGHAG